MNRARQKWMDLQSWESRYNSIAIFVTEVDRIRKDYEISSDISDSQIAEAITDVLHHYDDEINELEDRIVLTAFEILRR